MLIAEHHVEGPVGNSSSPAPFPAASESLSADQPDIAGSIKKACGLLCELHDDLRVGIRGEYRKRTMGIWAAGGAVAGAWYAWHSKDVSMMQQAIDGFAIHVHMHMSGDADSVDMLRQFETGLEGAQQRQQLAQLFGIPSYLAGIAGTFIALGKREKGRQKAMVAEKAKDDFHANMAHELRTPLNAIIGFSDLIKQQTFGPLGNAKYAEYVNDIHGSGAHLLDVINDILDTSSLENDKMQLQESDHVDMGECIDFSLKLASNKAEENGVTLSHDLPYGMPLFRVDEKRIKQILLNLLSNAVKFTPEGGEVSLDGAFGQNGDFLITVRDTGIGMDEEGIEQALTPYGQVDSNLSREHTGTGLGLPLAKSLVELHGGEMEIKSVPGEGTAITFSIPAERIQMPQTAAAE